MPDILRILQVAFGIGLIIFVHELGHYLAARWAGVRVHVFSLGFGPKLFGKRKGHTMFQVSAVPLGGYVAVAGEVPGAVSRDPLPDELGAKTIFQRFVFYSGGVAMNLLFALIALPIAFTIGVPFTAPVISSPTPGSPAWEAGLTEGTRIVAVGDAKLLSFMDLATKIALADPGPLELTVLDPGSTTERSVFVEPERDETAGINTIGVRIGFDAEAKLVIEPESPAFESGLRTDERLLEVLGGRRPGESFADQLGERMRAGAPLVVRVANAEGVEREVVLEPRTEQLSDRPRLGISPAARVLLDVRSGGDAGALKIGDRLLALGATPLLKPGDLRRALLDGSGASVLQVERDGRRLEVELPDWEPERRAAFADDLAIGLDVDDSVLAVFENEAGWLAGMRGGDRVLTIDGERTASWSQVETPVRAAGAAGRALTIRIERPSLEPGGVPEQLEITATPAAGPTAVYGLSLQMPQYVYRTSGPIDAFNVGVQASITMLQDVWLTLKRMVTAQVSTENIGGIISISVVSYSFAESGLAKLLYFLCLLSLNLAFINVLPVPLLDGGHLLFLLVEKIKGSPVSDRVVGYSQMVGLVMLVGLMVYVTYNDLMRVLPGFQ